MRSLEQIVADNGNDNTPALDTHNLTGRALRLDADHTPFVEYFDVRTQASFVWDGKSNFVQVCIGGSGEPVDHSIPAPVSPHNIVNLAQFEQVAREHADTLPTY